MSNLTCAIVLACYNEETYLKRCIESCLNQETNVNVRIFVADDGSTDTTPAILRQISDTHENVIPLFLEHGERGIARNKAIALAQDTGFDYLLIIDCDMVLKSDIVASCAAFIQRSTIGAVVIPELSFSESNNYWTNVKVFERNTLYHAGSRWDTNSIEAARFWTQEAFIISEGLNPEQVAFEDLQLTLRYVANGGQVGRITTTHILHDEKYVTLASILKKKFYYFTGINTIVQSEDKGLRNILSRWYFFRPVLYHKQNLIRYIEQPHLALGMYIMYCALTVAGVIAVLRK